MPTARNIDSALALDGSKVCVQGETHTQLNLADYFRANNKKYQEMKFGKLDDVVKAYDSGKCDVLTADVSQLYALRLNLSKPDDHVILPDIISKEPLAPVVRERDDDWMLLVKWTLYAMINAEELGITSKNIAEARKAKSAGGRRPVGPEGNDGGDGRVIAKWAGCGVVNAAGPGITSKKRDEARKSKKPDVMRLVGTEGSYGEDLGLTKDWAARIIRHVGNYGEVYDRNVGSGSKLKIPRGLNQLWSAGGIQYAPPIR